MMTLTDVYCRANRARGLELLSPEDLLHASRRLAPLGLPIVLRSFDSGVMVLQIRSHDDHAVVDRIAELVRIKRDVRTVRQNVFAHLSIACTIFS